MRWGRRRISRGKLFSPVKFASTPARRPHPNCVKPYSMPVAAGSGRETLARQRVISAERKILLMRRATWRASVRRRFGSRRQRTRNRVGAARRRRGRSAAVGFAFFGFRSGRRRALPAKESLVSPSLPGSGRKYSSAKNQRPRTCPPAESTTRTTGLKIATEATASASKTIAAKAMSTIVRKDFRCLGFWRIRNRASLPVWLCQEFYACCRGRSRVCVATGGLRQRFR